MRVSLFNFLALRGEEQPLEAPLVAMLRLAAAAVRPITATSGRRLALLGVGSAGLVAATSCQPSRERRSSTAPVDANAGVPNAGDDVVPLAESLWVASAGLAAGLAPSAVALAEAPTDDDVKSQVKALVRRVLELRNQAQYAMEPWLEEWEMKGEGNKMRDHDGEELVLELAAALRNHKLQFTDPVFPPSDASLYRNAPTETAVDGEVFRKDLAPFLQGIEGVEWKRAGEIGDVPGKDMTSVVFSDDIAPDDIAQGNLGNCYYLAALASCASAKDDHLLKDLIIEEGQDVGIYGVKFFVNGRWVTVVVDDYFPCTQDANGAWQPIFAHSKDHDGSPETQVRAAPFPNFSSAEQFCLTSIGWMDGCAGGALGDDI